MICMESSNYWPFWTVLSIWISDTNKSLPLWTWCFQKGIASFVVYEEVIEISGISLINSEKVSDKNPPNFRHFLDYRFHSSKIHNSINVEKVEKFNNQHVEIYFETQNFWDRISSTDDLPLLMMYPMRSERFEINAILQLQALWDKVRFNVLYTAANNVTRCTCIKV